MTVGCSLCPLTTCPALRARSHEMGSCREQRSWLPLPSGLQSQPHLCPPSLPSWEGWLVPSPAPATLALARPQAGSSTSIPL